MENAIMQMVFGHMMRGKTSAGMRRNRSQKVSLEHMALFRLPGESQDRYLLRELQIAVGMKHLQLLLDSVAVWGGSFSIDAAQKEFKAGDPGSSLGVVYYPDASVVWDLQGWGVAVGGTCILVSGEVSSSTINGYSIAPAFGLDFHVLITYTWVVPINDRSRKGR